MEKLMSALSLSQKARKLILGFDLVKEVIMGRKAMLVLTACDLSPKSQKEVAFLCQKYSVESAKLPFSMDELWYLLGKRGGIIAVTDGGFSEMIRSAIENAEIS